MNTTDLEDKKFIEAIKNNLIDNAGDSEDKKDVSFKTIQELIKDQFQIYKETTNNKVVYHVVKDVNSRKIINTFRKNLKFLEVDPKGTVDNFHLLPGGLVDRKLKDSLARALARRNSNYKNHKVGTNNNKTQSKDNSQLSIHSIFAMLKLPQIKGILPSINNVINNNSFEDLLNIASSVVPGMFGVSGIENISAAFKSVTGVVSNSLIDTETNLQGLLTYIFGDEGQVVLDFEQKNNNFVLTDYKSPQITTMSKKNRDTILYRKDSLEKLFNKLKPIINVGIWLLRTI